MNSTITRALLVVLIMGILGGASYGEKGTAAAQEKDEGIYTTRTGGSTTDRLYGRPGRGIEGREGEEFAGSGGIRQRQNVSRQPTAGKGYVRKAMEDTKATRQGASHGSNTTSRGRDLGIFAVTNYTAGYESTGKRPGDKGYGITATGAKVRQHYTIAADWKVLPPGTKVRVEGLPYVYVVEDKGGAVNGKHIDIYTPSLDRAVDWGKQQRSVTVIE